MLRVFPPPPPIGKILSRSFFWSLLSSLCSHLFSFVLQGKKGAAFSIQLSTAIVIFMALGIKINIPVDKVMRAQQGLAYQPNM